MDFMKPDKIVSELGKIVIVCGEGDDSLTKSASCEFIAKA